MSESDMLLTLCEQACNDGQWLAALKLIALLISSPAAAAANDESEKAVATTMSADDFTTHFVVYILNNLEQDDDYEDMPDDEKQKLLQQIHNVYTRNIDVLLSLSKVLFGSGLLTNALKTAQEAVVLEPYNATALETFENICCHTVDRWHFVMLNDLSRNQAYQSALHEIMSRFHRHTNILDVGCGTGLLSFLAAKWSNKIYAVEKSPLMCQIAKNTLRSYNLDKEILNKITIINKMSTDLSISADVPTRVDVLVTEIFDAGFFGEGIVSTLTHAWKQLLKGEGKEKKSVVIPCGATLFVEGIESEDLRRERSLNGWKYGLTKGNLHITSNVGILESDPYTSVHLDSLPLGYKSLMSSKEFLVVDLCDPKSIFKLNEGHAGSFVLDVTEEGSLDALSVWFKLHLTDSIHVSTCAGTGGCWEQAVFPVSLTRLTEMPESWDSKSRSSSQSLRVRPGDKVYVVYSIQEDRLSMGVTSVTRLGEPSITIDKSSGFPTPNQLLPHPLAWCPFNVYCLADWEIKALNNTLYQENLLEALQQHQQSHVVDDDGDDIVNSQFLHINDGFSPLCLEALSLGFYQVQMLTSGDSHKALLWKLVQLNKLDIDRIKMVDDVSELAAELYTSDSQMSEFPELQTASTPSLLSSSSPSLPPQIPVDEKRDRAVVVFDVVDHTGRLVENWTDKLKTIKEYLSGFKSAHILPLRVDIWGLFIDSNSLKSQNRIVSDENVLGYPVKEHLNKYSTMNHPDLCLSTLQHTKLTSPFKIFTLSLGEKLHTITHKKSNGSKDNQEDSVASGTETGDDRDGEVNGAIAMIEDVFNQTVSFKIPTIAEGKVDALVYWFDLHLSPCHHVSTLDPAHHWHQAAVVLDHQGSDSSSNSNSRPIRKGEELHLKFSLQSSTIFVSILE